MEYLYKPIVLFLSRRDWSLEKLRKNMKKIMYGFLIFFLVTVLRIENVDVEGSMLGFSIYASVPFLVAELILFSLLTLFTYYYFEYYKKIKEYYKYSLFTTHKEVVCAYSDEYFGTKVYKIAEYEEHVNSWTGTLDKYTKFHIQVRGDDNYYFDDWRVFKFVGVKESRKMKLQKLKDNLK